MCIISGLLFFKPIQIAVLYGKSLFTKYADSGYICRCSERSDIAAERRTRQQSEVKDFGADTEFNGDTLNNGKHGSHIGDIVYKSGKKDRTEYYDRV